MRQKRTPRCAYGALLVCLLAAPGTARAAGVVVLEGEDLEQFKRGMIAYQAKEYPRALTAWMELYQRKPQPLLAYNIARASLLAEQFEQAQRYASIAAVSKDLEASYRAKARATLATLHTRKLARAQAARLARAPAPVKGLDTQGGVQDDGERIGWLFYSGIGATLLGAGALGWAAGINGQLDAELTATPRPAEAQRQQLQGQQRTGRILFYSGLGLVALGMGAMLVDVLTVEQTPVELGAGAGPAHAHLTVRWMW